MLDDCLAIGSRHGGQCDTIVPRRHVRRSRPISLGAGNKESLIRQEHFVRERCY